VPGKIASAGKGLSAVILLGSGTYLVAGFGHALIFNTSEGDTVSGAVVDGLIFGLACLAASFYPKQRLASPGNPASLTILSLYSAVEFLAGARLVLAGGLGLLSNPGGDLGSVAITLLGLIIIVDWERDFTRPTVNP
jgi:hypothetical protein